MSMTTVIRCGCCGREQVIVLDGEPGGVTEEEAREIGWELFVKTGEPDVWLCPFELGPPS
jgi:hypothetical protein